MNEERDPLEERLRAALAAEAEDIEPAGDGLSRIRGRITERHEHAPWWARLRDQWMTRPALAAAASVGVIVLGLGATIGIGQAQNKGLIPPIGNSASTSSATSSTDQGTPSPTSSPKPSETEHTTTPSKTKTQRPPTSVKVPVYRITRTNDGYGVTQSSTMVEVKDGTKREKQEQRAEGALSAIFDGGSQLRGAGAGVWQEGTELKDAGLKNGVLQVMLTGAADSGNDDSPEAARAALQQIVFTGLDAAPSASSVQLNIGGAAVSSFWGVLEIDPGGVQRGAPALTRPFNTITAPADAATMTGSVTISGEGAYDGGQAHWQVLDEGGQVVQSGTESTGTGFANWSTTVDLPPGKYELSTFEQTSTGPNHKKSVSFTVTG